MTMRKILILGKEKKSKKEHKIEKRQSSHESPLRRFMTTLSFLNLVFLLTFFSFPKIKIFRIVII